MKTCHYKQFLSLFFLLTSAIVVTGIFSFMNSIGEGYVIVAGDTVTPINPGHEIKNFIFAWTHDGYGKGTFGGAHVNTICRASIFWLINKLSPHKTIFFYLWLVFLFSGCSAYFCIRFIFPKLTKVQKYIISFFYTCNQTTIFLFFGGWGFHSFVWFYVFIPINLFLFYSIFLKNTAKYAIGAALSTLLLFPSFDNQAYFMVLILVNVLLGCFSVFFVKEIRVNSNLIKNLILYFVLVFSLSVIWIIPGTYGVLQASALEAASSESLKKWLQWQNVPFLNSFRMLWDAEYKSYLFPYQYPFKVFPEKIFQILIFLPGIIWGVALLVTRKSKDFTLVISAVLLVLLFLVKKGTPPFMDFTCFIMTKIPFFSAFRSTDKLMMIIPVFYTLLLCIVIKELKNTFSKRISNIILTLLCISIIFYPLPFWLGNCLDDKRDDGINKAVKIPDYYNEIANYLNNDPNHFKIAYFPHGVSPHAGGLTQYTFYLWANTGGYYNFYGQDTTTQLFNKPVISSSELTNFNGYNFQTALTKNNFNEKSLSSLYRLWAVKYIIFHQDILQDDVKKYSKFMYSNSFAFKNNFGRLKLYEINNKRPVMSLDTLSQRKNVNNVLPLIYTHIP